MKKIEAINTLEEEGKLEASIAVTKELMGLIPNGNNDKILQYDIAKKYALLQEKDSAFHYLTRSITNDSSLKVLTQPAFYFLIEDERWKAIEDLSIRKYELKNSPIPNAQLAKELFRMGIRDQAFYYQIDVVEKYHKEIPTISKTIWELKIKINKENLARLEKIVEKNGYPKISEVTKSGTRAAFFVVQHSINLEKQKRFLPIMKEQADKGEIRLADIAYLSDRINIREGKQQLYGTQLTTNPDGTFDTSTLVEPEYVNQRRKAMGMSPIEKYLKKSGIPWTIDQKKK